MPLLASNFTSNSLQGTVVVSGGWANIDLQVDAFAFEGDKSFTVKLRKDSTTGQVIGTSNTIAIYDYSGIVSLTANTATVNEGNLVGFTLTTTNVANYTNVFYSVLPVTSNVTLGDFSANTGVVTIINNVGTFALRANSDLSLMDETGETFKLQVRTNSPTGNIVYVSSNVAIADVSKGFNILSFVENNSSVAEGGTLTLTFNATNIPVGTVLYYSTDGNATTSTFTGGNTGSFVMNGLSNTVTLLPTAVPYSATQNFTVQIRRDSLTGTVLATSNNIIAIDSALAYMNATGGTIVDSDGYRIHAFTTSGNLTVSALGAGSGNFVDYLVVAGGAAGGRSGGDVYNGGGGGGAGGALLSNTTFTSTGTSVITVGAGGALVAFNVWPLPPGGNTTVTFAGTPAIVAFGGGGGAHSYPGHGAGFGPAQPGGSGGGGNFYGTFGSPRPAGNGTPGQGYPGGTSSPVSFAGATQQTWAGGGGGAGEAGHYQPTDSISPLSLTTQAGGNGIAVPWAPPSTGTSGPAPGRYFAGGGGGGGSPNGTAYILSGGAGGGGAGGTASPGYPTSAQALGTASGGNDGGANATINTGGGGGGAGNGGASSGTGRGGLGGSGIVLIRYPYAAPITISNVITTATAFLVGSNITFTINATNGNATTLYYTTDGNVTASNFIGGNTGSFVANASGGIVTLQANTNIPLNESRSFRLQIRQDSTTGFISGSSANVIVSAYSTYTSASGGNQVIDDSGYRHHIFLSSNTLTINSLSQTPIEVFSVAGGGGSAPSAENTPGSPTQGATAGGGAGGYILSNISIIGATSILIGGGGALVASGAPGPGNSGSNTTIGSYFTAIGGGGGGRGPAIGRSGGSGGGGGGGAGSVVDGGANVTLYGHQGYPGGKGSMRTSDGTAPAGGGGGGAGQQGGTGPTSGYQGGHGGNGISVSWVTPSYGTPGPAPGRWFGGGGGGGHPPAGTANGGAGGAGGGGRGGASNPGTDGTINTGGGAGGHRDQDWDQSFGRGGSGIVIIRYPYI